MAALNQVVVSLLINAQQFASGLQQGATQIKQFASNVQSQLGGVTGANTKVGGSFDTLKNKIGNFVTDSLGKLARFTGYFLAVQAVTKIIGAVIEEVRELDEQLRNIQSITLESDTAIKTLGKDLLLLTVAGKTAGRPTSELAAAMYELVSAGYTSTEALELVQVAAVGAAAGLSTTDQT